MTIGKREQTVLILIGALLMIFLVHRFIFRAKAEEYARVSKDYGDGLAQMQQAQIPPSPGYLTNYSKKTAQYNTEITSALVNLNLDVPQYYKSDDYDSLLKRVDETLSLLQQLVKLKSTVTQPSLLFLEDLRQNKNPADPNSWISQQFGWNLQPQLPEFGVSGALWDTVVKLHEYWTLMNAISNPQEKLIQRVRYNDFLRRVGINPAEVCDWIYPHPQYGYVFFNDSKLASQVPGVKENPISVAPQCGVLVPALKRTWIAEMIWAKRDPNTQITRQRLYEFLEVGLPINEVLLSLNKQLRALIDIIQIAEQDKILEIRQVKLMRPVPIRPAAKAGAPATAPAASGAPAGAPAPPPPPPAAPAGGPGGAPRRGAVDGPQSGAGTMGGGPRGPAAPGAAAVAPGEPGIGTGTGIELYFRADNAHMTQFLFDITHAPRTYALDDLNIIAYPDGNLYTTTTVEMVTVLNALTAKK